jgi:glycine/D-amino acid oxidase-like deaminating enzyme
MSVAPGACDRSAQPPRSYGRRISTPARSGERKELTTAWGFADQISSPPDRRSHPHARQPLAPRVTGEMRRARGAKTEQGSPVRGAEQGDRGRVAGVEQGGKEVEKKRTVTVLV